MSVSAVSYVASYSIFNNYEFQNKGVFQKVLDAISYPVRTSFGGKMSI